MPKIKSIIRDTTKTIDKEYLAGYLSMVGASLPAAPSVRIAKSRQSSMAQTKKAVLLMST